MKEDGKPWKGVLRFSTAQFIRVGDVEFCDF
jgi:hypothetical protein